MSFLNELNSVQREAVKTIEGPVMIVAGAGSGKTRVLTYRIAYLLQCGIPAYNILALTFTNKAAQEMSERIGHLVGKKSDSLWMGTFHSLFARILRVECEAVGYHTNFTIYDTVDSLGLIKNVMEDLGLSQQRFNPQAIRSLISTAKNQIVMPEELAARSSNLFEEKTALVYAQYQKQLRLYNAMDFDDLLLTPIRLFQGHKKVLEKYQDRFRFILVDEYQDTNRAQYLVLNLLASKHKNICVVGDDAQSIYAFRGADVTNMLEFEKNYPQAKLFRLEQNYRSTKTILHLADQLIRNNLDQISKNLWTDNPRGEAARILVCEDDRHEGACIASTIYEECRQAKFDFKDFAILYRTNAQSRSIEDALRYNGIPYTIVGGIEFYQRKEIKDVLAYFRVLANPNDQESLLRIINVPNRGIGKTTVEHLLHYAASEGISLFEALQRAEKIPRLLERAKKSLGGLSLLFAKYRSLKTQMSLSELCRSLIDEIGILRLFKEEGTVEAMSRWENVQEFISAISEYSNQNDEATLEGFLQQVSLVSEVDTWDDKQNAVTLMTLHSAKGLEFPVVFIAGMEEGLLPFYHTELTRTELEEERRLCYVGITRAQKKLYFTHSRLRYRFGEVTHPIPSRFLDEIGREGLETVESVKNFSSPSSSRYRRNGHQRKREKQVDQYAVYHSDEVPDYHTDSFDKEVHIGRLVEHEVFGRGTVLSVAGKGEERKAIVNFSSVGQKMLLLKYARLKLL
jgi:DNA helicase-2/ATP-dependent DNA helicase PcrA